MINFNVARKFGLPLALVGAVGLTACAETVSTQPQEAQAPPAAESQQLPCEIKSSGSGLKVDFEIVNKGADFGENTEHVFDFGDGKDGSEKGSTEDHTYTQSGLYEVNAGYRDFFNPEGTYYGCSPIAVYVSTGAIAIKPSKNGTKKTTVKPSARATGFNGVVP